MQKDFHYYATYCAAFLAGYSPEDSVSIAYSAQFVDCCSATYLKKIKAPEEAATTQSQLELADIKPGILTMQNMTRIWASFHFLPGDLYAGRKVSFKPYMDKYRLLCNTNGDLILKTVKLAKYIGSLQASGIAMHVLADTWAHAHFAGTPSFVINNTNNYFYEIISGSGDKTLEEKIRFKHDPRITDDLDSHIYVNSAYNPAENSVLNLGHARAGHLPDYSFVCYKYLPAWGDYAVITKDNPSDYYHAFCQMVYAMRFLRGEPDNFETDRYDTESIAPYKDDIMKILRKRQLDASEDWSSFAQKLTGQWIEDFDAEKYSDEYIEADAKEDTFLGHFIEAATMHKVMVTNEIRKSGNMLAGKPRLAAK